MPPLMPDYLIINLIHPLFKMIKGQLLRITQRRMATMSAQAIPMNVLGTPLDICCVSPVTGYFRDGFCQTSDSPSHLVCTLITDSFLLDQRALGNDLITPRPELNFVGLKNGDKWCVHIARFKQAVDRGNAPKIYLSKTHYKALEILNMSLEELKEFAIDE